jgi:hypothetical protein
MVRARSTYPLASPHALRRMGIFFVHATRAPMREQIDSPKFCMGAWPGRFAQ